MDNEPITELMVDEEQAGSISWSKARRHLAEADYYWLGTVGPDGGPHSMPVLAIWSDGAMHFCTNPASRKARNLERDARCVLSTEHHKLHLVVEGKASKVLDEGQLQDVAEAYASKYGWIVSVREGALYGDGAPTAGPPPYEVYRLAPVVAFGLGTADSIKATRWRF